MFRAVQPVSIVREVSPNKLWDAAMSRSRQMLSLGVVEFSTYGTRGNRPVAGIKTSQLARKGEFEFACGKEDVFENL